MQLYQLTIILFSYS